MSRTVGPVTTAAAAGAGVSGSATILIFWLLAAIWGVEAPAEVHGAVAVLLAAGGAIIGGWISPSTTDTTDAEAVTSAALDDPHNTTP